MTSNTYHHGNLREALLDTAMDLLTELSISEITMKRLSDAIGVSHNAPYRHFKNKTALQAGLAERGFDMLTEQMQIIRLNEDLPLIDRFVDMGKCYTRFGLAYPDLYRLMYGRTDLNPNDFPELQTAIQKTRSELLTIITSCQAAGLIRQAPRRYLATYVWASIHGLTMLLIDDQLGRDELESILEISTQTTLEGLAQRDAQSDQVLR